MDLRNLPEGLPPDARCQRRLTIIEEELGVDLSTLAIDPETLGQAEEKNCENMFGQIPIPVGLAGPLSVQFSSGESIAIHLPLATTEGALVASVNRGCKALVNVRTQSIYHGISRSIAFKKTGNPTLPDNWEKVGEETSNHLKILKHTLDETDEHLFLTIYADTDEAMGMNMVTIAAQAIGNWIDEKVEGLDLVTVAGNVDSDKKPSKRTRDTGRGYEVKATATITNDVIESVLKSTPGQLVDVTHAKLSDGSLVAGALGSNLHAANVIAALYLATGQDAAHVVEGSLADTTVSKVADGITMSVRVPAVIIGIRGGGTSLPAQEQALGLILKEQTNLHPCAQLAESIGAAVLAGELSLLAAQASQELAKAHKSLSR